MDVAKNDADLVVGKRRGIEPAPGGLGSVHELNVAYDEFVAAHDGRAIDVDGQRWHYLVGGHGSAVLLLAGGSMCPDSYFPLIGVLEDEHLVIAPIYPAVSTIAGLVKGLAAVLDAECVPRVAVFGASFGGYVAQAFVRSQPGRVDRLVLSHTGLRHPAGGGSMAALATVLSVLPARLVRAVMWRVWMRLFSVRSPEREFWRGLLRGVLHRLSKAQLVAITRCLADFADYRLDREDLAGWPGAVLILDSAHDAAYGQAARAELRAAYPAATVHTFHDAGHTALWTEAVEYNEVVRSFLALPATVDSIAGTPVGHRPGSGASELDGSARGTHPDNRG